jgi:hypothetical protein
MIGKNLAIENSFYLQFQNTSQSDYTIFLFNSGSSSLGTQTIFITSSLWSYNSLFVTNLTNSVFTSNTTVTILDNSANVISSVAMTTGQTLAQYLLLANPIIDINGNQGTINILQTAPQVYDVRISRLPNVSKLGFSPDASVQTIPTISTFVRSNAFITCQSTVPIEIIQASETGNSYAIMGLDIYSTDQNQILEGITYGRKDSNGNFESFGVDPTIDPYQSNKVSVHAIDVGGLIIDVEATFSYVIRAAASSRLTFNYVKASVSMRREFDQALASQLTMKYLTEKKYLDNLVYQRQLLYQ